MANPEAEQENMGQKVSLNLLLSPEEYERLHEMRNMTEVRSKSDVIKNALRFYDWFVDTQNQGDVIQIELDKQKTFNRIDAKTEASHLIILHFSSSAWMRFEGLRKKSEVTDNQGLILDALNAYNQYLKQRLPGNKIKVTGKDSRIKEVEISFM